MKAFPCIESTYEQEIYGGLVLRIWRDAETVEQALAEKFEDVEPIIRSKSSWWHLDTRELAEAVAKLPRVNAVHVHGKRSNPKYGVILYVNWP